MNRQLTSNAKDRPNPPSPWGRGGTRLSSVLLLGHRFPICSLVAPSRQGGWRSRRAYVHLLNEAQSGRRFRRFVTRTYASLRAGKTPKLREYACVGLSCTLCTSLDRWACARWR